MRLILASASPRRLELLTSAGIACDVDPADIDEQRHPGEDAARYALRMACSKADVVSARHPGARVLAADTIVVVDEAVLGKPVDVADARTMLERLSGREHEVLTAVAVVSPTDCRARVARTTVWMRALTRQEIDDYAASGEPMDKAGAYAIQGGAAGFIDRIDGEYSNVVGLPLNVIHELLGGT